jgi:hypothetical protein
MFRNRIFLLTLLFNCYATEHEMLTKIKIMLFRKTTFCFGDITCWSRKLKSRVIEGLLTVSEIRDAMSLQFSCESAAGECLAKGRVQSQQYESCHTQDDTHFPPDIHDSRQPRSYLYAQKYSGKRARLTYYVFGGTSHSLLCTVRVMSLLLNGVMAGLNKCDSRPPNTSRVRLKCDGTRAETRFRVKRTSPFQSAGVSVQSTTGSRGVHISGSNAGYTMFRGSVKSTGYPLH